MITTSSFNQNLYFPLKLCPVKKIVKGLKWFSCFFAVMGGVLLASKTVVSGYGFILLAMSSSQMLVVSCLTIDKSMICYFGAIFLFVDCLGMYRWLLA